MVAIDLYLNSFASLFGSQNKVDSYFMPKNVYYEKFFIPALKSLVLFMKKKDFLLQLLQISFQAKKMR